MASPDRSVTLVLEIEPQTDDEGNVVAHDNPAIDSASLVIRKISKHHIVDDANGNPIVTTASMQPSTSGNKGLSVDLEALILSDELDPRKIVSAPEWLGTVSLTAGEFRSEDYQVGYDPQPENIYHGEVWGHFSRGRRKRLLGIAQWYVEIPGVVLS